MTHSAFDLTAEQEAYLDRRMNEVSRSFAIVVPNVESPLDHYLATAYLICRVVDNIEDCTQPYDWQVARFDEFVRLLEAPERAGDVLAMWDSESWPGLTDDEIDLMSAAGGSTLWEIYGQIPAISRAIIRRWSVDMAGGMVQIEDPAHDGWTVREGGVRTLTRLGDYNQYCYYVAGTVGHMATELVIDFYGLAEDTGTRLLDLSEACGRGLQKTNIVKDFAKDLARGVCYLPREWLDEVDGAPLALSGAPPEWTMTVLGDVLAELRDATDYVLALPYSARGYRIASLLCLLPAYETILLAAKNHERLFTPKHKVKISRLTMARCMKGARAMVGDNDAVAEYSRRAERAVEEALGARQETESAIRPPLHPA